MSDIKLILDTNVVDRYNEYYFSQHPKAKKKQIEHPYHPSINVWAIKPRIQMNALKQSWKAFIIWWIKDRLHQKWHDLRNYDGDNSTLIISLNLTPQFCGMKCSKKPHIKIMES